MWRGLRLRDLIPVAGERVPWRAAWPTTGAQWFSAEALLLVFIIYCVVWVRGNHDFLFDPLLQNDDAYGVLIALHRYTPEQNLVDDPIANDLFVMLPPAFRYLNRLLIPTFGLYATANVIQGICYGIILAAGWLLIRSRRGGLATGLLLIYLMLHTWMVGNRIGGGLPRAFGLPAITLWISGALTGSERARYAGILLAAAMYPSALLIMLGAEAMIVVGGRWRQPIGAARGRWIRFALVMGACAAIMLPYMAQRRELGRVPWLHEIKDDPVIGGSGRVPLLDFIDPLPEFGKQLTLPFMARGDSPFPWLARQYELMQHTGPLVIIALLLLLIPWKLAPPVPTLAALLASSTLLYYVGRVLAFRLYEPDRFIHYGVLLCPILLATSSIGLIGYRWSDRWRPVLRNVAVTLFIVGTWWVIGDGVVHRNATFVAYSHHQALYDLVRALPQDTRIALHPRDGQGISYWTGRATTDHHETYGPILFAAWPEHRARSEDTLSALYAIRRQTVREYAAKYDVSHFLLNRARYGADYRAVDLFRPLRDHARRLVDRVDQPGEFVLGDIPDTAIVFAQDDLILVDVARLRAAWRTAETQPGGGQAAPDCATRTQGMPVR